MVEDAKSVYQKLRDERGREIAGLGRRQRSLAYGRLAAVAAAAVVVWFALSHGASAILWVLAPIGLFAFLMVAHNRLEKQVERLRRAERFFEGGLARLDGQWMGKGQSGERYLDPAHPYAQDLDLFGRGSLFELLCTARTHIGEDTLARWLLSPADPETVRHRQQAVDELRPRLDLREDLAVIGEEARTGVDPVSLAGWGEAPSLLTSTRPVLWSFTAIGVLGLTGAMATMLYGADLLRISKRASILWRDVFLASLAINGTFLYRRRAAVDRVVGAVEEAADELQLLSGVLVRLESERFRSPRLAVLGESLAGDGDPPSARIARLRRILQNIDSRDNVFLRVAEVFILWTPHCAAAVEEWRRHSGRLVRGWLTAVGEMEALCSLASHAYENPGDPYAEFAEGPPVLNAVAIGHPLIPRDRMVRNDVRLGGSDGPRVLVVSGSNMSGKSTMMRTLGVNCVLANAGAPVRALRLRISPLAVGASIRLVDSLQEGVSRFYAEILRLRQILDLTEGNRPVLFLIDEVLHGTNSHDRRIGAEALVRGLVERGAVGLITTHDLALAEITSMLGDRAANVHFEDHIEDGRIHFDYIMRPGVVRKSNAIELMRQVGLEI